MEGRNGVSAGRDATQIGTKVKTLFTIGGDARYAPVMFVLLAAAIANAPAPPPQVSATARATATIRVVHAARVHFDRLDSDLPRLRLSRIKTADGGFAAAKLVEFE